MKKNIFLLSCFLLAGCTFQTLTEPPVLGGKGPGLSDPATDSRLTRIGSVRPGMTSREVAAMMGETTIIGYERQDAVSNAYHPVTVANPYHKELLRAADKTYDVFYYFTHIQKADGIISSDELTPLVFENDILIGKGRDFLIDLLATKQNVNNQLKSQTTAK